MGLTGKNAQKSAKEAGFSELRRLPGTEYRIIGETSGDNFSSVILIILELALKSFHLSPTLQTKSIGYLSGDLISRKRKPGIITRRPSLLQIPTVQA